MSVGFCCQKRSRRFLVLRDFWILELQDAALFFILASKSHLAEVGPAVCQKEQIWKLFWSVRFRQAKQVKRKGQQELFLLSRTQRQKALQGGVKVSVGGRSGESGRSGTLYSCSFLNQQGRYEERKGPLQTRNHCFLKDYFVREVKLTE